MIASMIRCFFFLMFLSDDFHTIRWAPGKPIWFMSPSIMSKTRGQCRKLRTMSGHLGRVGTMAWNGDWDAS